MIKESGIVETLGDIAAMRQCISEILEDFGEFGHKGLIERYSSFDEVYSEAATLIAELQAELTFACVHAKEYADRALAAESSLHRVRGETIEAAVKIIAQAKAREVEIFDAANRDAALSDTGRRGIQDRALGRDSLARDLITSISSLNITGLDTGAVKTAESSHSPSTLNAETE